jgi:hypothetical protein
MAFSFPQEAIEILRGVRWNPDAAWQFDLLSGGIIWDDEFPSEVTSICINENNWAFRAVLGYRASLIRGKPDERLRPAWEQLLHECPEWPGFRPERRARRWLVAIKENCSRLLTQFEEAGDEDSGSPTLNP